MQESDPPPNTSVEPPSQEKSNRSALFIVFLVVFIDLLGFGIVLPLLPRFANTYVENIFGQDSGGTNGLVIGLLMSSFSLMQFLFAPVWGKISDRIGRRPILLLGLGGSVVFYMLFGYAASLPQEQANLALALLFVARIGAGMAGATIATAQAVIADSTPPDKRKHGMALIGAAFGIGFTFGPIIGFLAYRWFPGHHEAIGYTAAGLSLIALILGFRLLPETRVFGAESPVRKKLVDLTALWTVLGNPAIGPVVLAFFLATLGFAGFEVTLALFLKDTFGFTEDDSYLIFAFVGFVLMFTQGFLYRRLAKRLSEVAFMTQGILFMGVGVGAMGGVSWLAQQTSQGNLFLLLLSLTAAVVGFAFLTPSAQALISRRTSADQQGEILGVNQSAAALARILGPILSLTLYKLTETHLLPYFFGAGLLFLMLPLLPRIRKG